MPLSLPAHLRLQSLTVTGDIVTIGKFQTADGFETSGNNGTPGDNMTVHEKGDAHHHLTNIIIGNDVTFSVTANATESHGVLLYTLPPHSAINNSHMHIKLTGTGNTGVPVELGVGTEEASGNGTSSLTVNQDNIIPNTNENVGDMFLKIVSNAGAAFHPSQPIYLNVAGIWAATGDVVPSGTITLDWTSFGKIN